MGHAVIQIPVTALGDCPHPLLSSLACPHITVLGPLMDERDVDPDVVETIREVLSGTHAFNFELSAIGHFHGDLSYLAPSPAEPFKRLTALFAEAFPQWPPYGGMYDEVTPHLSIGHELSATELDEIRGLLPIRATASEITLTWWDEGAAENLETFPLPD